MMCLDVWSRADVSPGIEGDDPVKAALRAAPPPQHDETHLLPVNVSALSGVDGPDPDIGIKVPPISGKGGHHRHQHRLRRR